MGNLVKTVEMRILAQAGDAQKQLDDLAAKGKELDSNAIRMRFRLDDGDAKGQMDAIRARADALGFKQVDIKVRVDGAGRAVADLAAVRHEQEKVSGGGILARLGGLLGGAGGASLPLGLPGGLPLPALAAAVPAAAALAAEVTAVGTGFAAAGAGAGAFALLAVPAIHKVEQALKDISKGKSLDALKLSPDEKGAVSGIRQLETEFGKLSRAFQPQAFKVFADGLKVVSNLLPHLTQFANPFATALDGLFRQLAKFTASKGFNDFLSKMASLVGPATTAIGQGIGKVAVAVGHLLTVMSKKDVIHGINTAFTLLAGGINVVTFAVSHAMSAWDQFTSNLHSIASTFDRVRHSFAQDGHDIAHAFDAVRHGAATMAHAVAQAFDTVRHALASWVHDIGSAVGKAASWFGRLPGMILHALGNLGGLLVNAGKSIIGGLIRGIESGLPSLLGELGKVAAFIAAHKGPESVDRVLLYPHGRAIMGGLIAGIGSERPALMRQLHGITADIGGTTARAGYGHGAVVNYNITVNGAVDKQAAAREIHQLMLEYKRNGGRAALGLA